MTFDMLLHRRPKLSFVASGLALFGTAAVLLALGHASASRADALNPYRVFTDSGPVTQEDKDRRQEERDALYVRLSPQYRMDVPFVSEAAIVGLQQAIERYRHIVAGGGWPQVSGNVTLRPGDTGAEIATIRKHLIIEGDLPPGSSLSPRNSMPNSATAWRDSKSAMACACPALSTNAPSGRSM